MKKTFKVILIGNYEPDKQESMARFVRLLASGLSEQGIQNEIFLPDVRLHRYSGKNAFLHKWLGYLDKYWLFPSKLKKYLYSLSEAEQKNTIIHICDHSNAPYAHVLKGFSHLVTCHDLTAIKSALDLIPHHTTRATGKIFQRYITRGIQAAQHIACVSATSQADLMQLLDIPAERCTTLLNGLNAPFAPMTSSQAKPFLRDVTQPYWLHVGGSSWYKNRVGVAALFNALRAGKPDSKLVFVGPSSAHELELAEYLKVNQLTSVTHFLEKIDHNQLNALYSQAEALLFPSHAEGFGWPIIEAQATGCPVVILDKEPMRTVAGSSGICLPTLNHASDPKWFQSSKEEIEQALLNRAELVQSGLENAQLYSQETMIQKYIDLYHKIIVRDH